MSLQPSYPELTSPVPACPDPTFPEPQEPNMDQLKSHPDVQQSPFEGTHLAIFTGYHGVYKKRHGPHGY